MMYFFLDPLLYVHNICTHTHTDCTQSDTHTNRHIHIQTHRSHTHTRGGEKKYIGCISSAINQPTKQTKNNDKVIGNI